MASVGSLGVGLEWLGVGKFKVVWGGIGKCRVDRVGQGRNVPWVKVGFSGCGKCGWLRHGKEVKGRVGLMG